MSFIILGVIILIAITVIAKSNPAVSKFAGAGRLVGLLFITLGIIISSVKQVDPGEIGIKILFGNIQKDVLGSGLHFVNPLLDIKKLDVNIKASLLALIIVLIGNFMALNFYSINVVMRLHGLSPNQLRVYNLSLLFHQA